MKLRNTLFALLLASCSQLPINLPGEGFQAFSDGFETGVNDRWHWEITEEGYSARIVGTPVFSGASALEINLRQGDRKFSGTRSEAAVYHSAPFGMEVTYRFAFYLPASYSESSDWQLLAQWHDIPDFQAGETWDWYQPLSPPVSFTYKEGILILTMNTPGNHTVRVGERAIAKDTWHQVELRAYWHDGSEGWIECRLNGTPLTPANGEGYRYYRPNLYNRAGNYFKIGLYRSDAIATTNTVYFDNIEVVP